MAAKLLHLDHSLVFAKDDNGMIRWLDQQPPEVQLVVLDQAPLSAEFADRMIKEIRRQVGGIEHPGVPGAPAKPGGHRTSAAG